MRKFVVYSENACTSPKIGDLKAAGRIDILLHSIISAMFASHTYREDVELHLIMMGPPYSPRHIRIVAHNDNTISKKNLKRLIEICLKKFKKGSIVEVHPGVFVDDKTLEVLVDEFKVADENIYMLDFAGTHIKKIGGAKVQNGVFILGDHDGFDKKKRKYLKKTVNRMSLGLQMYFTSQAIMIINYEIDSYEYLNRYDVDYIDDSIELGE
jgi:tRNA (pseudouridine54-N1)-methyltransferase